MLSEIGISESPIQEFRSLLKNNYNTLLNFECEMIPSNDPNIFALTHQFSDPLIDFFMVSID